MAEGARGWHLGTVVVVVAGYVAVTVAESILAPLFPSVAAELDIDLALAGAALGVLTGTIAVTNLAGGLLLARRGPRPGLVLGLVLGAVGSALAASASNRASFVLAQAVIGAGAGVFFAPSIDALARAAGSARRGLAMGVFGVAFSGGLTAAAFLAAAGAGDRWRTPFWVAVGACSMAAVTSAVAPLPSGPPAPRPSRGRADLPALLLRPVLVGSVGTVSQYGTVAFLALFAVSVWGMSPAAAALMIGVGRVVSAFGKLMVGAASDRWGPIRTLWTVAGLLVAFGLAWSLAPGPAWGVAPAVVYAAAVSALFPVANILAVEGFGDRGVLLGTYRSIQIGVGAAGAWAMGNASAAFGLRPTLILTILLPLVLLAVGRARQEVLAT